MEECEAIFKSAGDSYRRAEQHLVEAETSLRKLLARFLVAEIEKPAEAPAPAAVQAEAPAPAPVRVKAATPAAPRRENAEIWGRVEELLAARRAAAEKKAQPVVS